MHVEKINNFEKFQSIRDDWNALLVRSHSDMVCLTPEWINAWWVAFGHCKEPLILTVRNDGQLIALAPLMVTKAGAPGPKIKQIHFMANGHSPRSDIITDRSLMRPALHAIAGYLNEHRSLWDVIELRRMPSETGTAAALGEIVGDLPLKYLIQPSTRSPYIPINKEWNSFYGGLSAKFRKVMRNKLNRVQRLGNSTVEQLNDPHSIRSALETVFEISSKSWKGRRSCSIASTAESQAFYRELANHNGTQPQMRIWFLRIEGKPVAFECHLHYRGKAYALSSDFDESYHECTPGSVLDRYIVEEYFRAGLTEYDLCGADYPYKLKWTGNVREHVDVFIYHSRLTSEFLRLWHQTVMPRLRSSNVLRRLKEQWKGTGFNGE